MKIYLVVTYMTKYYYVVQGVYSSVKKAKKGVRFIKKRQGGGELKIIPWYTNNDFYQNFKLMFPAK